MSDEIKDYTETVSVRLTKAQVEQLKQAAVEMGMTQSDFIRQWVETLDVMPVFPQTLLNHYRYMARQANRSPRKQFEDDLRHLFFGYWQ